MTNQPFDQDEPPRVTRRTRSRRLLHPAASAETFATPSTASTRRNGTSTARERLVRSSRSQWSLALAAAVVVHTLIFAGLVYLGWSSLLDEARRGAGGDDQAAAGSRGIPISLTRIPADGGTTGSLPEAETATVPESPTVEAPAVVRPDEAQPPPHPEPIRPVEPAPAPTPPVAAAPPAPPTNTQAAVSREETRAALAVPGPGTAPGSERGTGDAGSGAQGSTSGRGSPGSPGSPSDSGNSRPGYLSELQEQVQASLRYARRAQRRGIEGDVVVAVVLDARGALQGARVQSSSGRRILDDDALKTARRAAPFGPPPDRLIGVEIEIPVSYGLVDSGGRSH